MFKNQWTTYVGVLLAVGAVLCGVFDWISPEFAWSIAGIFGFTSIASLRAFLEEKGWKTYFSAGVPILANILVLAGVIDLETAQVIMGAFGALTAATLQQTLRKKAA